MPTPVTYINKDVVAVNDPNGPSVNANSLRALGVAYCESVNRDPKEEMDRVTEYTANPFTGMDGDEFLVKIQNLSATPLYFFQGNNAAPYVIQPQCTNARAGDVSSEGLITVGVAHTTFRVEKGKRKLMTEHSVFTTKIDPFYEHPVYVDDVGGFLCIAKHKDWVAAYCQKKSIIERVEQKQVGVLNNKEAQMAADLMFFPDEEEKERVEVGTTVEIYSDFSMIKQVFYIDNDKVRSAGKAFLPCKPEYMEHVVITDRSINEKGLIDVTIEAISLKDLEQNGKVTTPSGRIFSLNHRLINRILVNRQTQPAGPLPSKDVIPVKEMDSLIEGATANLQSLLDTEKAEVERLSIALDGLKDSIKDRDSTIRYVTSNESVESIKKEKAANMLLTRVSTFTKVMDAVTQFRKASNDNKLHTVKVVGEWAKAAGMVAGVCLTVGKVVSAIFA